MTTTYVAQWQETPAQYDYGKAPALFFWMQNTISKTKPQSWTTAKKCARCIVMTDCVCCKLNLTCTRMITRQKILWWLNDDETLQIPLSVCQFYDRSSRVMSWVKKDTPWPWLMDWWSTPGPVQSSACTGRITYPGYSNAIRRPLVVVQPDSRSQLTAWLWPCASPSVSVTDCPEWVLYLHLHTLWLVSFSSSRSFYVTWLVSVTVNLLLCKMLHLWLVYYFYTIL